MSTDSYICHTSVVTECVGLAHAARRCGRDARVSDIARRLHTAPTGRGSGRRLVLATTSVCVCLLGLGSGSGRGRYMWRADILVHSDRADLSRRRRTSRGVYVIGQRVSWAKLMQFGVSFRRPPDGCVSWIRQWRGDALNMDYRRVTNIRISAHLTHSRKFRNFVFFCHWGDDIFWPQSPNVFTGMCTQECKVDSLGLGAPRIVNSIIFKPNGQNIEIIIILLLLAFQPTDLRPWLFAC